ncbi:putative Cu-dependent DNA-binding protein [Aspergillus fischeri NRRL 181]|uniref:Cu-dependent DNA-binding protein, putative n=1 Tax=Neosartorya fischeri (strain ATCC 1020 / DSM 3700 / CBS 544.65 / FGSC A1164 / JCM 1740 / NRRL 181 / WB 181) TaxID=331117 RepID=A1CYG3_NEOFI|nr:Cu-dependent DNA-binding protein, putative [Aspergillus fischeri NRRL 181]EAW23783.1 Cu-dependent DNA-binding protein, putative [Aspergillus fischeri NRRL 181]
MLIDGEKWACEACVRGHRVTTCKHNDRPLIRIARKGRPFSTCSVCNCTPCQAPEEHTKLRREADTVLILHFLWNLSLPMQYLLRQSFADMVLSPVRFLQKSSGRPCRPNSAFQPIAPRPSLDSATPAASHAAISPPLAGPPSAAGAVPARPGLSPRPRSSTDTDTQMRMSQSPGYTSGDAHAQRHPHPHPGARSTAPALPVPLPVFTTAPPPSHFPLTCGSFATPALASVADIPVSMAVMHGDAHGAGFLFADGNGYAGDGVFSLDDLDVGVGVGGGAMMQPEWGDQFWLGDDSV